jgi:hypothetical protein
MGLTRKKVTVRTKKGKTFQRSVMVRAEAIGKRASGKKLNSLNPWEARHTEHVKGQFPKSSGSSGPGSDHSWLAVVVGAMRPRMTAKFEPESYTEEHARLRRSRGQWLSTSRAEGTPNSPHSIRQEVAHSHGVPNDWSSPSERRASHRSFNLAEAFGVPHTAVHTVPPRGGWGRVRDEE